MKTPASLDRVLQDDAPTSSIGRRKDLGFWKEGPNGYAALQVSQQLTNMLEESEVLEQDPDVTRNCNIAYTMIVEFLGRASWSKDRWSKEQKEESGRFPAFTKEQFVRYLIYLRTQETGLKPIETLRPHELLVQLCSPHVTIARDQLSSLGPEVWFTEIQPGELEAYENLPWAVGDSTVGYGRNPERAGSRLFIVSRNNVPKFKVVTGTGGKMSDVLPIMAEALRGKDLRKSRILITPLSRSIPEINVTWDRNSLSTQAVAVELLRKEGYNILALPELMTLSSV